MFSSKNHFIYSFYLFFFGPENKKKSCSPVKFFFILFFGRRQKKNAQFFRTFWFSGRRKCNLGNFFSKSLQSHNFLDYFLAKSMRARRKKREKVREGNIRVLENIFQDLWRTFSKISGVENNFNFQTPWSLVLMWNRDCYNPNNSNFILNKSGDSF